MQKIVDKVALLVFRDKKVLFARSRGQTLFYTVGGKRKPGETDEDAARREAEEETGAQVVPDKLKWEYTFRGPCHNASSDTVLKMTCLIGTLDREPVPMNEIEELAWLSSADMDRTTEMGRTILDYLSYRGYID